MISKTFCIDNMEYMKTIPDKFFELACVDPPYFEGPQKPNYYAGTKQRAKVGSYKTLDNSWELPNIDYFNELFRVSKNQIIWGINYFNIALPGGRIVWVKGKSGSPFSMADIAYQSFYNRIELFNYIWAGYWQETGFKKEQRIHPTQKPVALYKWLFTKFAKTGDKILDTHLGSQSSRIAAWDLGFDFYGCELDTDYFKDGNERFEKHKNKQKGFFQETVVDNKIKIKLNSLFE